MGRTHKEWNDNNNDNEKAVEREKMVIPIVILYATVLKKDLRNWKSEEELWP